MRYSTAMPPAKAEALCSFRRSLEHDPEKGRRVFPKRSCSNNKLPPWWSGF